MVKEHVYECEMLLNVLLCVLLNNVYVLYIQHRTTPDLLAIKKKVNWN